MKQSSVYMWKDTARVQIPAQVAGEELSRIRDEHGKFFTPHNVVESAKRQGSPLHNFFQWDNTKAAESYREEQARYLIRNIIVTETKIPDAQPVRAFVSVRVQVNDEMAHRFTSTVYAFSREDLREQMLQTALQDIRAFKTKYEQFIDLTKVLDAFHVAQMNAINMLKANKKAG